MIQYADHESENESLPRMVRWNENGFAIPTFDDVIPVTNDMTGS